jgi:hypothetical protein
LCEQHSSGPAQRSPSVVHVEFVVPGGSSAQTFPAPHTPEQHSEPLAQVASMVRHASASQVAPGVPAFGQLLEQQSAFEAQSVPGDPQNAAVAQPEGVQMLEQHSLPAPHARPTSVQAPGGGATTNVTVNGCGELLAPAAATDTVAPYVPAARLATAGSTPSVYGAEAPETVTVSQPAPVV